VSAGSSKQPEERLVGAQRVVAVLKKLADYPEGVSLQELSASMNAPKPTIHRDLAVLCRADLATHDDTGWYRLGDDFLRIAFQHHRMRPEHRLVTPALHALSAEFGEATHYAALDGRDIVYLDKVTPSRPGITLNSTIGGRSPAHATAIGKVLLAWELPDLATVKDWVGRRRLEARTERTVRTVEALHRELDLTRSRGFGVDDQENEVGVNCLAVAVFIDPSAPSPSGAVSVSALTQRLPMAQLVTKAPRIAQRVAALNEGAPQPPWLAT